jgi:hypothetical protein
MLLLVTRLVAVAMMSSRLALATTIVGIWTEKRVTIVADSKQTVTSGGRVIRSVTGCKTFQVRQLIVALAGLAAAEGVNVVGEIKASKELVSQDSGAKLPRTSVVVAAEAALVKVLKKRDALSDPGMKVEMIIAGTIDGRIQMYRVEMTGMRILGEYSMPNMMRQYGYPDSRGHDGSDPNRGIEVIGWDSSVKKFKALDPAWNQGNDLVVARRLVAIEASDTEASKYVGAPFSSVSVDKKGVHWIDKGPCK